MADAALLFDLDGTLIDSDPLHAKVFIEMFAERGRSVDHRFYLAEIHGRHNTEIFGKHLPDEDAVVLHLEKEARFRAILGPQVPPVAGAVELIEKARRAGWGLGVVTNAPRLNAEAMLAAIGLGDAFDAVIVGEECERGKPHPAPYIAAMDRLGALSSATVAFEDSPSGLASARAAGALTVGLRSSLDDAGLRAAGAQLTIADFTDPALAPVIDMIERIGA